MAAPICIRVFRVPVLPRDAVLAGYLLWTPCLSITNRSSIKTAEQIELVVGKEAALD